MKKLLLLLFLIPNLVMGGGMGGSKESAPGKNPFEILKEVIDNKPTNHTERAEGKAPLTMTTKLIYPTDIDGAEEIYEVPKLKELENYGDIKLYYLEKGEYRQFASIYDVDKIIRNIDTTNCSPNTQLETINACYKDYSARRPGTVKCQTYKTGGGYVPAIEENVEKPNQPTKDYKTNTNYKFIKKLDKNITFAKDNEQIDHKIYPKLNGNGDLTINLDASYSAKKYFETPLFVTFSAYAENSCATRAIDSFWYDPNKLKLIKDQPETKIKNTEKNKVSPVKPIVIIFDGAHLNYYDGLNLHKHFLSYSPKYIAGNGGYDSEFKPDDKNLKNVEIKIQCPSCQNQKDYLIKVDVGLYQKNHAVNIKKQEKNTYDKSMAPFKSQCSDIGFKKGTEKFGDCVLELMQ